MATHDLQLELANQIGAVIAPQHGNMEATFIAEAIGKLIDAKIAEAETNRQICIMHRSPGMLTERIIREDIFSLSNGRRIHVQFPSEMSPEEHKDVTDWLPILARKFARCVKKSTPDASPKYIHDDFGSTWVKCASDKCSLHIVRPGKVQCDEDVPECPNYKLATTATQEPRDAHP